MKIFLSSAETLIGIEGAGTGIMKNRYHEGINERDLTLERHFSVHPGITYSFDLGILGAKLRQ